MTGGDDPFLKEPSLPRSHRARLPADLPRPSVDAARSTAAPRPGARRAATPPAVPRTGGGRHRAATPRRTGAGSRRRPSSRPDLSLARPAWLRRRSRRRKPKPQKSFLFELPGIVATALLISVLIKTFLVQAFYIPSGSMENTLLVNDRVLVNKLVDRTDEIKRGQVVVFRDPGGWLTDAEPRSGGVGGFLRSVFVFIGLAPAVGDEDLIKRVIGVGGDRVRCCDASGRLTVNGVALTEPYVFPGNDPSSTPFDVRVPADRLWVMGDHRGASEDSRAHHEQPGASGFVPVEAVIGRAFVIVWPPKRTTRLGTPETFDQLKLDGARQ